MIIPYEKLQGETMHQMTERFRLEYPAGKKIAYGGNLDPLASGLVIMFTDESVSEHEKYTSYSKEYTFSTIKHFKTDTYDIMGLVTTSDEKNVQQIELKDYRAPYPPYSTKRVKPHNKSLWYCQKNGLEVQDWPEHNVTVHAYRELSNETIQGIKLLELIKERIGKVKGDFRQEEIIKKWTDVLDIDKYYDIEHHTITLSKGGYVRYFANMMNSTCFDIRRIAYKID